MKFPAKHCELLALHFLNSKKAQHLVQRSWFSLSAEKNFQIAKLSLCICLPSSCIAAARTISIYMGKANEIKSRKFSLLLFTEEKVLKAFYFCFCSRARVALSIAHLNRKSLEANYEYFMAPNFPLLWLPISFSFTHPALDGYCVALNVDSVLKLLTRLALLHLFTSLTTFKGFVEPLAFANIDKTISARCLIYSFSALPVRARSNCKTKIVKTISSGRVKKA